MPFSAGRGPSVWVLVAAFLCHFATTGFAQAVVDPATAEFDPSADHNALDSSGAPLVNYYLLAIYSVGGTTAVQTINLGKPAPDSDGKIRIDFTALVSSLPAAGVAYEARVSAIGWGGAAASGVSNQFSFSAACDPSIGSAGQSLTSAAGSGSVSVTAASGCGWTAVSSASWLTVTSGASGTGNGTVSFSASANTGASLRTATLTIGGEIFTVSQAGTSCAYTISPTSQTVAAVGGTGTITVATTSGCAWTATSSTSWLTISSGATGTGNGSVGFTALASSLSTSRTGTITAAGKTFTVTQSASTCSFSVSPLLVTLSSTAITSSVTVTTATGCAWSATETATWLSISSGTGRTGSGSLSFSATANTGASRTATMTVAGKAITVSQSAAAAPAAITVTPTTLDVATNTGASTTAQQITISQGSGTPVSWTVTIDQPWLQASPASGSGAKLVSISLEPGVALPTTNSSAVVTVTPSSGTAKTVQVTFTVIAGPGAVPFGTIETPADNTGGVTGSIPVTGWALDDIDIARVRVLRDPVAGEGSGEVLIGNAVLVEGARPDVAAAYPTLPHKTRAGWGYLLLTNMLPNQGNGTFRLSAYADDVDGHTVLLGSKTITCTNSTATAPFGAIDTPAQGETVSGTANNFGWVLSRGTRRADPPGGGNVRVVVDGAFLGSPAGWTSRPDLSSLFPVSEYSGINTAAGVYGLNTASLANGVHTIAWVVTDNLGVSSGIGSRYFSVLNGGSLFAGLSADMGSTSDSLVIDGAATSNVTVSELGASAALASVDSSPILARRGYAEETPFRRIGAAASGLATVQSEEMDRIELALSDQPGDRCTGYSVTAGVNAPLPVGSSLDPATCVFTWQAGLGFVGTYDFVFLRESSSHATVRRDVRVVLNAKRSGLVGPQVVIDIPGTRQVVGRPFVVAGWAADLDADVSTGVDTLHVWAYPVSGDAPQFLGAAAYGGTRPDVAAIYGNQFRDSGYGLEVSDLPAGTYDLAVFAWSNVTGGFVPASTVRVTVK
jgi:hypothetical protein